LPGVAEKLGYYVYLLIDPRSAAIFYVGKGKGDRVFQHAKHAKKVAANESRGQLKLDLIREIHDQGLDVRVEILRHGLDEAVAFEVEAAVMDALELADLKLTNLVAGHATRHGWRPLEDIVASYAASPVEIAPEHRVVLIRISRRFRHGLGAEELYEMTREWWRINPRRNPEFAFAVYEGIVRAVYRIESWHPYPVKEQIGRMKGRWAFRGSRDPRLEERYLWTDVSSYLTAGAQNPIKYVNC
jgi:uncharacterized protein